MVKKGYKQTREHIINRFKHRKNPWLIHEHPRGMLNKKHSLESIESMSKKRNGIKHSEEWVKKRIKNMTKTKNSKEWKNDIKKRGSYSKENNPMYGKENKWGKHSEESRRKISIKRKIFFQKHPEKRKEISEHLKRFHLKNPLVRKGQSKHMKEFYNKHPEKHPNRIMAKKGFISKPEKYLLNLIKNIYKKFIIESNYPVKTFRTTRYIDIALPQIKVGVEYDGEYWHQNKEKDRFRDEELKEVGWKIIHMNEDIYNNIKKIN